MLPKRHLPLNSDAPAMITSVAVDTDRCHVLYLGGEEGIPVSL